MDGALEEATLFEQMVSGPMYALASTGGATAALHGCAPKQFSGGLDERLMTTALTYTEVAEAILGDLRGRGLVP